MQEMCLQSDTGTIQACCFYKAQRPVHMTAQGISHFTFTHTCLYSD